MACQVGWLVGEEKRPREYNPFEFLLLRKVLSFRGVPGQFNPITGDVSGGGGGVARVRLMVMWEQHRNAIK